MSATVEKLTKIVDLLGLTGASVSFDAEQRKINILADEGEWFKEKLPQLVKDFKHIANLVSKRVGEEPYVVDVNNYRKERENIIINLAKAAAQKTATTKESVTLPPMNSYERRLVHMELAMRPDVETESTGEGHGRAVVVRPAGL